MAIFLYLPIFSEPQIVVDNHIYACYNISMVSDTNTEAKLGEVYILHFEQPYWSNGKAGCRHYVGYTTVGTENRIAKHRTGRGSLLVRYAFNKQGIPFEVGLVVKCDHYNEPLSKHDARELERRWKNEGHLDRHCEICKQEKADAPKAIKKFGAK